MGAEDPYRHMERAWDLVQGKGPGGYPPGITMVLAPLTLLGPTTFYNATRFLPVVTGVSLVAGLHILARRHVHPAGALAGAMFAAIMPETIRRTDLMFPTAFDLGLLPWFLLLVLQASQGSRRSWVGAAALVVVFLVMHPWLVALLAPPIGLFAFILMARRPGRARVWALAVVLVGALAVLAAAQLGGVGGGVARHAFAKAAALAAHPSSLFPLPYLVNLPANLGLPALVLGGVGVVVAFLHRDRFSLLALLVPGLLLPFILVDWFDIWYIPHRTVAYFAVGLCLLIALAVGELCRVVAQARPSAHIAVAGGTLVVLLLVSIQPALAMPPWYRIFTADDQEAWHALDARGTPYVEAGSWQGRMGYRALTGRDAVYNPPFFQDANARNYELKQHPGLVVLVDPATHTLGTPTSFLSSWPIVGQWGNVTAYRAPSP
jgi:hypothetical protein